MSAAIDILLRAARPSLARVGIASRHMRTSVGRVHVLDVQGRGELPPLVLIHGLSAAGAHYWPLLDRLRPRFQRIVVPDMPLHGLSDEPKDAVDGDVLRRGLFEALEQVNTAPAWVFGNSLGGLAAVRYALEEPRRVRGLVLCSPAGARTEATAFADLKNRFRVDSHRQALEFVDRLWPRAPYRHALALAVRRRFAAPSLRKLLDTFHPGEHLTPEDLIALRMPTMLFWGDQDYILPPENFDFFRDHLPAHARVERPAGMAHSPYLNDAPALSRLILSFVTEAEDAARES